MTSAPHLTRRTLLVLGASTGAAALCPLAAACGPSPGAVVVGNVSDFQEGLTIADGKSVIVGRDAKGLYAMTAICTHLGCDMSGGDGKVKGKDELDCTCHGAQYDAKGEPKNDVTSTPLDHLKLIVDGERVIVVIGSSVDPDERVAV
jgi:Rieske Fe-S protein